MRVDLVGYAGRSLPLGVEEVHEPGLEGGQLTVQLGGDLDKQVVLALNIRTGLDLMKT